MVSLEGVKLLGEQDSHKFASLVLGSSSNFVSRDEGLSTFGAASYIDCPDEKSFALLTGERGRINREQNYQKYIHLFIEFFPIIFNLYTYNFVEFLK